MRSTTTAHDYHMWETTENLPGRHFHHDPCRSLGSIVSLFDTTLLEQNSSHTHTHTHVGTYLIGWFVLLWRGTSTTISEQSGAMGCHDPKREVSVETQRYVDYRYDLVMTSTWSFVFVRNNSSYRHSTGGATNSTKISALDGCRCSSNEANSGTITALLATFTHAIEPNKVPFIAWIGILPKKNAESTQPT